MKALLGIKNKKANTLIKEKIDLKLKKAIHPHKKNITTNTVCGKCNLTGKEMKIKIRLSD